LPSSQDLRQPSTNLLTIWCDKHILRHLNLRLLQLGEDWFGLLLGPSNRILPIVIWWLRELLWESTAYNRILLQLGSSAFSNDWILDLLTTCSDLLTLSFAIYWTAQTDRFLPQFLFECLTRENVIGLAWSSAALS